MLCFAMLAVSLAGLNSIFMAFIVCTIIYRVKNYFLYLNKFRWMLEELLVSLFAQELKNAYLFEKLGCYIHFC